MVSQISNYQRTLSSRNILSHRYDVVDDQIAWGIVQTYPAPIHRPNPASSAAWCPSSSCRGSPPLADCAGPAEGRNIEGLTPMLASALLLPHATAHGPLALSLRFPRRSLADGGSRDKLRPALETYFRAGGQRVQVSAADTDELREAIDNPELRRDLVVRVGGFNAHFVELDRRWQEDLLARSELGGGYG